MFSRSPNWCGALVTVLVALTLPLAGCSKKKKDSAVAATPTGTVATTGGGTPAPTNVSVDNAVVTDASSLIIPSSINLIPPKGGTVAAGLRLAAGDFDSDRTETRLQEDMFSSIDKAVGILCFVSQTRGIEFLNKGAYTAYVDGGKCGMNDGQSQQGSVAYDNVSVLATQDGTHAPKIQLWVHQAGSNSGGGDIYAELSIAQGPSASNPLGVLKMQWNEGNGSGGYIETRKLANPDGDGRDRAELLFQNVSARGDNSETRKGFASVYVTAGSEPTDGYVATSSDQTGNWNGSTHTQSNNYKGAFNLNFVSRTGSVASDGQSASADACLDRNAFVNFVQQYNLYDNDTGSRIELSSGKPGECTVDGAPVQANFSYYGIWNSANASASALSACKFVDFTNGTRTETPIEIVSSPGKLVKYTSAQTTLGALKGLELNAYSQGGNVIVKWTGNAGGFQKVAVETCGNNGCNRAPATGAAEANSPWNNSLGFYVPTLDAQMSIRLGEASDDSVIYYFNKETVSGTDATPDGDLVCFDNCPKMAPSAQEMAWMQGMDAAGAPFVTRSITFNGQTMLSTSAQDLTGSPLATYTFDDASLLLKQGSTGFALPAGLSPNANAQISSGALVKAADFATLTTEQKAHASGNDLQRLFSSFYRWESGASQWSQFAGVKAGGAFVHFDRPIDLSYTFNAADNLNATYGAEFYGAPVRLTYGGTGNLWGIPMLQNGNNLAKFSLKDGTVIGRYKVKPTRISQTLSAAASSSCAALSVDRAPDLASLPVLVPPTAVDVPTGDLALKVIGGELITP